MSGNAQDTAESRGHKPSIAAETAVLPAKFPLVVDSTKLICVPARSLMQEPVLVVERTYEPINVTAGATPMVLMLKGVAQAKSA